METHGNVIHRNKTILFGKKEKRKKYLKKYSSQFLKKSLKANCFLQIMILTADAKWCREV